MHGSNALFSADPASSRPPPSPSDIFDASLAVAGGASMLDVSVKSPFGTFKNERLERHRTTASAILACERPLRTPMSAITRAVLVWTEY